MNGDPVNHPAHYTAGRYETIDVIEDIVQFYPDPVDAGLAWQVLKYTARAPHKGRYAQDLQKALFYLSRLVKRAEGHQEPAAEAPEHDGCTGCKYEAMPGSADPCYRCRGTCVASATEPGCLPEAPDLWERMEDDRK